MKKIFLAMSIVAVSFAANAQKEGGVNFGLKAGANLASMSITDTKTKMKFGFHVGAFANVPLASSFSVQPEVVYSAEGAKADQGDGKYNLGLINIPVMFQYNDESGFYGETGPQLGLILSANAEGGGQKVDYKEFMKSTNFSWAIGAGYKMSNGFGFGARYNIGLSNLAKEASSGESMKASALQISLYKSF